MQRIFITGGTGFFGKSILDYRLRHPELMGDAEITILSREEINANMLIPTIGGF